MHQHRIETMIMKAMDALVAKTPDLFTPDGQIPSKYIGYVAAFGPSVSQAGLLQTLAFYNRTDGEGQDRQKVIVLMQKTLIDAEYLAPKQPKEDLFKQVMRMIKAPEPPTKHQLKTLVLEAASACKLAMRTFPKKEEKPS